MGKLSKKNVLITGSSSGIGKAIAFLFAREGANIILCSNTSTTEGVKVLSEVKELGSEAEYFSADLQRERDIKDLFKQIGTKYDHLDILINNAGRTFNVPFDGLSEDSLLQDVKTNLLSAILCSKYAVEMMTGDHGWIVNTSSVRGIDYCGRPGILGYSAAKTGINSITKTLASQLAPKIFVNAVAPGLVNAGYVDQVDEETRNSWLTNIPICRFIPPEEIAEVYLLLATSKIFAGSVLVADGGYSILRDR